MKIFSTVFAVCGIILYVGCGMENSGIALAPSSSISSPQTELIIAAAASLTDVTKEITAEYKKVNPNVTLTFTYGSSGAIQTQIEQGSPVDVFISAATRQMDALEKKELIDRNTRINLLENKLVLITPQNSKRGIKSFNDLTNGDLQIALGDPASVPVGQYAQEVFTSLNMWELVKAKANFATDVRQVLTWVESGNVDCGVVYRTDAATSKNINVVCEAPEGSCQEVIYPAAVVKNSKNAAAATDFLKYIKTPAVAKIFESYGFNMTK